VALTKVPPDPLIAGGAALGSLNAAPFLPGPVCCLEGQACCLELFSLLFRDSLCKILLPSFPSA